MDNINNSVFENICRTCLSTSNLTFINDTKIIDFLLSFSDIKYLKSNELPQKICIKCIKFMNEIQSFIYKCQQAHLSLIKCLSDLKNKQNTLLENETIHIVNVEDILKKTKIINNLETKQIVTKEFENLVAKEDEGLTLTNCLTNQKILLNNTTILTDNIQETNSSNVEEDATDQHNLELVTEYLEKKETVADDKKQNLITNSAKNQNILLKNMTINADEQSNKSEIICVKEEIQDEIKNVELVTEHFVAEELLFHRNYVKEEIKNKITNPNSGEINKVIHENALEIITKQDKDNLKITSIEDAQVIANKKSNLKQHASKQSLQCNVCNKIFRKKNILLRHKKIHITECSFKCDLCKKAFKTKSYLMTHKKIHSNVRQFKCDVCKKVFKSASYLMKHKKIHFLKKPYHCNLCNNRYKYKATLVRHMFTHSDDRRFECNICLKHFNLSYLTVHKKIHSNEKPYQCKVCNTGFVFKHDLVKHQVTHSDERPFECDFCTKTFKLAKTLSRHMRLLHNSERGSYRCEICNEAFTNKRNLLEHKGIHTDILLVKCEFCTERFTPNDMKQHKLDIHSKNEVHIISRLRSQKCKN